MKRFLVAMSISLLLTAGSVSAQEKVEVKPNPPAKILGDPIIPPETMSPAFGVSSSTGWFSADYLLWWTKSSPSPQLAVAGTNQSPASLGSAPVRVPTSPGFIGLLTMTSAPNLAIDSTTGMLFGNNIGNDLGNGGRFTWGGWLDSERNVGLEARYLFMITSTTFHPTNGVVGIPYRDAVTGAETGYPINTSGSVATLTRVFINTTPAVFVHLYDTTTTQDAGSLNIRASSVLQGGEANAIWRLGRGPNWHMEALVGFRFIALDETLEIASQLTNPTTITIFEPALGLPTGKTPVVDMLDGTLSRTDSFRTHNRFYGGQVGTRGTYSWGRLSLTGSVQVGFGDMQQSVDISGVSSTNGTTTTTPRKDIKLAGIPLTVAAGTPNVTTTGTNVVNGGLFAQPSNIGHYSRSTFAVVPEGLLKLNYQFNERVIGNVGYTFLYMSSVARPGDQIDRNTNPAQVTAPTSPVSATQPAFQFRSTDYWAQGVNFGLEFRY